MKRILSVLLPVTITAVSLAGYAPGSQSSQAKTSQPVSSAAPKFIVDKIGVTYIKSPLNVPSIVEEERGIFIKAFEEYSLPVKYSNLTTNPEQTQALASGGIQFLYAVGATSVILSASNGVDIKIINTYSRSSEAFRVFTGKDSKIQSTIDLKGEEITGSRSMILHELMVAYPTTADLTEKDVEFVFMNTPDVQTALVGDAISCALLVGPTAYSMEKDDYKTVTTGKGPVDITIVVAASQSFYDKNPLLVEHSLETQDWTAFYMKGNSEEILEMTTKETELSTGAVKEIYPMYNFSTEITDVDTISMKKTGQFVREDAMIENDVDFDQLVLRVE